MFYIIFASDERHPVREWTQKVSGQWSARSGLFSTVTDDTRTLRFRVRCRSMKNLIYCVLQGSVAILVCIVIVQVRTLVHGFCSDFVAGAYTCSVVRRGHNDNNNTILFVCNPLNMYYIVKSRFRWRRGDSAAFKCGETDVYVYFHFVRIV